MPNTPPTFQELLLPDEKILWEGEPDKALYPYLRYQFSRPLRENRSFLTSTLLLVVIVVLIIIQFSTGGAPINPLSVGGAIVLVLVFTASIVLPLRSQFREVQRLRYAITNKRVLMRFKKQIVIVELIHVKGTTVTQEPEGGIGTIQFQGLNAPVLFRLPEVLSVQRIISQLLTQK